MRVVVRGTISRARRWFSFGVSGSVHACLLAWVVLAGWGPPVPRARSIYDQEIRPYEKRIVWYSLREKLPEIAPADVRDEVRPSRARVMAQQTMVAGTRDDARPAPLIWAPEPEAVAPKVKPLPNVVAVAAPKVARPFVAPPVKQRTVKAASIEDAPAVAAALQTALVLPVAAMSGPRRAFTPPPEVRMQRQAKLQLPEAPRAEMVVQPDALPFVGEGPRPQPKKFVAPPQKPRAVDVANLPAAPEVAVPGVKNRPLTVAALIGRGPAIPAPAPMIAAEPAAGIPAGNAEATLAIVGLDPARTREVPVAPASRASGFSAGAEVREDGGTGSNRSALVNVPGLVVKGSARDAEPTLVAKFSPTSKENLLAAARVGAGAALRTSAETRMPGVVAPDPMFGGREVYSIAVQMPNVTSFSGSWLVWFAARETAPGRVRPPEVVRKVDPKYIAAAVEDRVEGTVRLFGVIGKDGRVSGIALLRHLDARLDQSAREALAKWEFAPAQRDGVAVDVDALFEIPFHLAPRPKQ